MRNSILAVIIWFICFDGNCQTNLRISSSNDTAKIPALVSKLIIDANASVEISSSITITDSLIVHGTLRNNGTITATNCLVDSGTICSGSPNKLVVNENITFKNARTTSDDTVQTHIVSFSAKNIFINGYTNMESGYLETENLIINDTLEFSGKLGVKTIYENLIINRVILCTQNESMKIYGNVINNSAITNESLNLELYGNNKEIRGKFSFYRIDLEYDTTFYTNYDSIAIKETFSGKGILRQAPNSYLKINAQTTANSPQIIANADGNTIEYSRGGIQFLTANECYNLILSKNNATLFLNRNCQILNKLTFKNKSFLDCNEYALIFSNSTDDCICLENNKLNKGIIFSEGTLRFENFSALQELHVPLYIDANNYAGFAIKNLDTLHSTFTVDSLFNFVTHHGDSSSDTVRYEFVNTTWHFDSDITNARIQLEWDTQNEMELFDNELCSVYHSEHKRWIAIEPPTTKTIQNATGETAPNGYFTVGNTTIILPIELEYFTVRTQNNCSYIKWKYSNQKNTTILEKSSNGIDFYPLEEFAPNKSRTYSYIDCVQESTETIYYRLAEIDLDGKLTYSNIISVNTNLTPTFSFSESSIQFNNKSHCVLTIYTTQGEKISETVGNSINIATIPHGTYIIVAQTNNNIYQQKYIW